MKRPPSLEGPVSSARVVDGDTLHATVSLTLPIRLPGIDTPELRKPEQKAAAQVAANTARRWLDAAQAGTRIARLRVYGLGLYSRLEGDLFNEADESLSSHLIAKGVAVRTDGDKRHEWTDSELKKIERKGQ